MEKLLDDLLTYSRAGRVKGSLAMVALPDLVADILALLAPPPGFTITVDAPQPTFVTYRVPLEVVLRNLISNAIKHHSKSTGAIRVQSTIQEDRLQVAVHDDGPGIAEEYQERIFGMFQTLRPRDEIESSGIGLAVVKKTIESLGGAIWLESQPGQGATFHFSWPLESLPTAQSLADARVS
jgi:signal transduction histidine kinase